MSTSRRKFLKRTIAGAGAAWSGLRTLAESPTKNNLASDGAPAVPGNPASLGEPSLYTRGIGVYPGDPVAYRGPLIIADTTTYRNLALLRPAFHSSSYDYNLTAQLVTDGIRHTRFPRWIATSSSSQGPLPKIEREFFLDHNPTSVTVAQGSPAYVDVFIGGGEGAQEIDRVDVLAVIQSPFLNPENLTFAVYASDDGRDWRALGKVTNPKPISIAGYPDGFARPGQLFQPSIPFSEPSSARHYRVETRIAGAEMFPFGVATEFGEVAFYRGKERVQIGGPYDFTSAWMSAGSGEEWVYVDLGATCRFDRVKLYWIARPAEGKIQTSDDARTWRDLAPLPAGSDLVDDLKLPSPADGRYVRVLMTRPSSPQGYVLSEFEVYGRGGFIPKVNPQGDGALGLDNAGHSRHLESGWRIQRDSLVKASGQAISRAGFTADDWTLATVPGTVLTSYLNLGAIPDPNYGQNQLFISDSFFYADFWYRIEFTSPELRTGQRVWLNFDGVNWKAQIFLNGTEVGNIDGGFERGHFDVTNHLLKNKNALAVRVIKNDTPGSVKQKTFATTGKNGGALGRDNPTYHASIGWDWIPTIRGRNTGIWGDVYFRVTGPVTIENPVVTTKLPLPQTSSADVAIEAELVNHESNPIEGVLRGAIGDIPFSQRLHLAANERRKINFDSPTHPRLKFQNPKLWWPNGYGEPNLYDVHLEFESRDGSLSDGKDFKAGLRQMTYSEEGGALKLWVNGRRFVARGGNWGFSESMLRYREREYDAALRYHKEMNFTMVRDWVGQIGDEAFYDACDRHGIMVWQDFWLANPWDGPDPENDAMFLANARDTLLKIRNHPSIGLYCGRNEGFPPKPLEAGLLKLLAELAPGMQYIPSSADVVVSGHGPYQAMPQRFYFEHAAHNKFHSEEGAPNIPPMESVRAMMPATSLWPQGLDWGLHDFCLQGAQNGASFIERIKTSFGGAGDAEEWVRLAQFVNYDTYRAMFEADAKHRMGLLLWMTHPCWPSFVWQTYDYYFDVSAAYFGAKKACEPLHIQWNSASEMIEVVNYSAGDRSGLSAEVEVVNMDGMKVWQKAVTLSSREDSLVPCFKMEYPARVSAAHWLRLKLRHAGTVVSSNDYLRAKNEGDFRAVRELPNVQLTATTTRQSRIERRDRMARNTKEKRARLAPVENSYWQLTTELHNPSRFPALMVRVKAVREKSGDRILPVIYNDNYILLMPGETRTIITEMKEADTRGEEPKIIVEGFNVASAV